MVDFSLTESLQKTLSIEDNVIILKNLNQAKRIKTLNEEYKKDVTSNIFSLRDSGLVVTILRNNPIQLQEYYKRTTFGDKIVEKLR